MNILYEIKDIMEDELKQISRKEQLTKDDICLVGEMIDVVKDIETIEAMKDAASQGWSRDYARDYSNGYTEDYSNAYGNMTRRGRDSMGRYTSRGNSYDEGYSRHTKDEMIENLKTMMMNARTPEERESYRATIEQMQMSK